MSYMLLFKKKLYIIFYSHNLIDYNTFHYRLPYTQNNGMEWNNNGIPNVTSLPRGGGAFLSISSPSVFSAWSNFSTLEKTVLISVCS